MMMDMTTALAVLLPIMIILLIFSSFFSASETAITSINVIRLKQMAKKNVSKRKKEQQIKQFVEQNKFINWSKIMIVL
ncbi:CNNM domain-containing protein [Spiroplasma endosymbiont of Seladonia tumulorum]|uniref:CNNM domain-containing protein n=1 Tax=Spiroplasma endosymbiont of Seladonia tumulorum TaxID=3066321 RepID=UPI0030D5A576